MKKHIWCVILVFAMVNSSLLAGISTTLVVASPLIDTVAGDDPDTLLNQITDLLTHHPLVQSRVAQLLDVAIEGEAIVINFDRQILDKGM